jgi:hypothetical protein
MIEIPSKPFDNEDLNSILGRLPESNRIQFNRMRKYSKTIACRYAYLVLHPKYLKSPFWKEGEQESPLKPSRKGQKRQRRVGE